MYCKNIQTRIGKKIQEFQPNVKSSLSLHNFALFEIFFGIYDLLVLVTDTVVKFFHSVYFYNHKEHNKKNLH